MQPVAQGDMFSTKVYMAGTGDNRAEASLSVHVEAFDQNGTAAATARIWFDDLDGCAVTSADTVAGASGGTLFTII